MSLADIRAFWQMKLDLKDKEIGELQAQLAKHRWIPVSERLPENTGDYQVSNGIWIERIWWDKEWIEQDGSRWPYAKKITHWKPITLPKGVEK